MTIEKKITVFDFDNTLTTTDTIKFTVVSLLFCQPWKAIGTVQRYVIGKKKKLTSEVLKHSIIGYLITGRKINDVSRYMRIYSFVTRFFVLDKCMKLMLEIKASGKHVVIATASPYFAINKFMKDYGIPVIGTNYEVEHSRYNGRVCMPIPFEVGKLNMVTAFMHENGYTFIEEAYSDSMSDKPLLEAAHKAFLVKKGGKIEEFMKE